MGAFKIFTYDSPSFLTSFNIYGTQLDSRYKLDFADLGAKGRIYDFYAPIEGVPLDINFLFVSLDPSVGVFPEFGYENFTQAQVVFVDQRNSQVIDGGVASFTVSYANSVPEPATWAMMIGGFGMIGGALRRRRPTHLSPAI